MALPVAINGYSGTVRSGTAALAGGHVLGWRLDALRSVARGAIVAAVTLRGPGTDLGGELTLRGLSGQDVAVAGLSGRAAWPLVAAVAPEADLACDIGLVLQAVDVRFAPGLRRGAGRAASAAGACAETGGAPVAVPALEMRLETVGEGLRAAVTRAGPQGEALGEALATNDDRLVVTVRPAGAALAPGMPASGETVLEFPLPWPPG